MAESPERDILTAVSDADVLTAVSIEADVLTANSMDFEFLRAKLEDANLRTAAAFDAVSCGSLGTRPESGVQTAETISSSELSTTCNALDTQTAESNPTTAEGIQVDLLLPEAGVDTARLFKTDLRSSGTEAPESNVRTAQSIAASSPRTARDLSIRRDEPEEGVETAQSPSTDSEATAIFEFENSDEVEQIYATFTDASTWSLGSELFTDFTESSEQDVEISAKIPVTENSGSTNIRSATLEDSICTGVEASEVHTAIESSVRTAVDADEIQI